MKKRSSDIQNSKELNNKKIKLFKILFIIWIIIFSSSLVKKVFQNDTFYTIKIGELIFKNGIDMMDHFSFHTGLAYTYPHWLYDCFIYIINKFFGYYGIYISSIIIFIILILIVFKTNIKVSKSIPISAFTTFLCTLAIAGFVTARAQLISFVVFACEILFIEMFLKKGQKKYLIGLLLLSLIICNIHVAVWPFYFILYLPYLAEYIISFICSKIKIKKKNKFLNYLSNKFILEKNNNIKYLFIIFIASLITGLLTPIGNTPYTYLIKTMLGNTQKYIQEHKAITWLESPFTIIIAGETIFLTIFSKIKLRDLFMICGLVLMSIFSVRHISLLALIGTICFSRVFSTFLSNFNFQIDNTVINFLTKKYVIYISFIIVIIFSGIMLNIQNKKAFIDNELYPTKAVKFIKNNIDINNAKIFNEYDFGSYLILNDIPVFIDSRADLYTKQFSKFNYDIFDDYINMNNNYPQKFNFYNITHIITYKSLKNMLYLKLKDDNNYNKLYEDEYFIIYERIPNPSYIITIKE